MNLEQRVNQQQTMRQKMAWLIVASDFEPVEVLLSGSVAFPAAVMLTQTDTFQVAQTYALMALISEPIWGAIAASLFTAHILSARFKWHRVRSLALFGYFVWWAVLSVLFYLSGAPFTPLNVLAVPLALGSMWAYWRYMGAPRPERRGRANQHP